MQDRISSEAVLRMATDIVVAYLSRDGVDRAELAGFIQEVRAALEAPTGSGAAPGVRVRLGSASAEADSEPRSGRGDVAVVEQKPAIPVVESVNDEYIISLEDGQRYRSLRRHLMAKYGMTPEDYRRKWGLPPDYPMVAPSYARTRSLVAKRIGLGKSPAVMDKRRRRPSN